MTHLGAGSDQSSKLDVAKTNFCENCFWISVFMLDISGFMGSGTFLRKELASETHYPAEKYVLKATLERSPCPTSHPTIRCLRSPRNMISTGNTALTLFNVLSVSVP